MNTGAIVNTQDVTKEYKEFLAHTAKRIKELRLERGLTLRDMVVVHGYHDSNWRRMEREGVGNMQSLLRVAKAFAVPLTTITTENSRQKLDHPGKELLSLSYSLKKTYVR